MKKYGNLNQLIECMNDRYNDLWLAAGCDLDEEDQVVQVNNITCFLYSGGIRCDPGNDKEYAIFRRWEKAYQNYDVRLS